MGKGYIHITSPVGVEKNKRGINQESNNPTQRKVNLYSHWYYTHSHATGHAISILTGNKIIL